MYSWGQATDGQLGIGAIEESHVLNPSWLKKFESETVHRVATGLRHTLFLIDGKVYSCGSNEKGQLGQDVSSTRPAEVTNLSSYKITLVGCGCSHSVAVTTTGTILTWGENEFGQLGRTGNPQIPSAISYKTLSQRKVVQVACGAYFNVMLTNDCHVLTWGKNDHGQLGHSYPKKPLVKEPTVCENLSTVPVNFVTAGSAHSLALSRGGYVFTCGKNNFGQLGLGHNRDVGVFTEMMEMSKSDVCVKYAACGEEHTVLLADNGRGYTCGSSRYGQLGHGDFKNCNTPNILVQLIEDEICQIACGRMHTMVALDTGEVYTFGLNASGQLGNNSTINLCLPTLLEKEWKASPSYYEYLHGDIGSVDVDPFDDSIFYMYQLFAGGDQSFVAITSCYPEQEPDTSYRRQKQAALLSDSDYEIDQPRTTHSARPDDGVSSSSTVAKADSSTNPPPRDYRLIPASEQPIFLENHMVQKWLGAERSRRPIEMSECVKILETIFLNPGCLNGSFQDRKHRCSSKRAGMNLTNAEKAFYIVRKRLAPNDRDSKMNYIRAMVMRIRPETLPQDYNLERKLATVILPSFPSDPPGWESLKVFYLLPVYMCDPARHELIPVYLKAFLKLKKSFKEIIGAWFFNGDKDHIRLFVQGVQGLLNSVVKKSKDSVKRALNREENKELKAQIDPALAARFTDEEEDTVIDGLEVMKVFSNWNTERGEVIPVTDFHISLIVDKIDLAEDYFAWMQMFERKEKIVFCDYPMCLDVKAKSRIMFIDCKVHQHLAITQAEREALTNFLSGQLPSDPSPYSVNLDVNRHNLVNSTLSQLLSVEPSNFKKPLKVTFIGEEGDDEGGVRKEFFMLLFNQILNPDFGMFVEDQESHLIWFSEQPLSYGDVEYFKLIGILCGLAMYNDVLIDLPFPVVLYRKLMNSPCRLRELRELHPSEGQSLMNILEYDKPDFQEVFGLTFAINRRQFGEIKTIQLVEGGDSVPVTLRNKDIYVSLYLKYCLYDAIEEPYKHFREGFMRVCGGKLLDLVHPLELKELLVGKRVVNWDELKEHMQYKNGYTKDDPTIKLFWEVFEGFTDDLKRKFLVFLTGSDRIPIFGVEQMHMIIQKMDGGPRCEKLPVAHTCFNVLDLPPYSTKDKMRMKLLQAINFTSGFGII